MSSFTKLLLIMCVQLLYQDSDGRGISKPFFRKDYTFVNESAAFYKVHTVRKSWKEAKTQCQKEGATLFYPEDELEADLVMGLWNKSEPYGWIYLGVSDLLAKGVWETVDSRPLLDVYNNWGAGQPDDTGGNEDCVLWRRDNTLNDYTCHEEYPFICKKSQQELEPNKRCDVSNSNVRPEVPKPTFRDDYTLIEETKAFYKVHTTRKAFHDARRQCRTEGAILFFPEDKVEAEVVMALWNRSEPYGWIYLGITDLLSKGHWKTVDGRQLQDVYNNWGAGQPDDTGGNEDCVLWRRDNTLNDYTCHEEYPFICKKSLHNLESNTPSDKQSTNVQRKPTFRDDYTLIDETKAFYKVHTTRKAFHDARRQCRTEGAILFYPEDKAEAEVAMALWNRSEPYGWIYLGITDLLSKGHWKTVDGRQLKDVYNNWGAGQPDDTGGNEDCVLWRRDNTLNDYTCHEEYPFICKKSLHNLESNTPSDKQSTNVQRKPTFRDDYTLIDETKAFYKVHTTRKAFHDARRQCRTEGAILFYPEDKVEAEVAMALWNRSEPYGWIYLGITDLLSKGHWKTVDGRQLQDVYNKWGAGQPDDTGGNEDCVLWRRDNTLNDYTCHEEYPFICKKSLHNLESNTPSDKQSTNVQPKPTFRDDYTLIDETKAFYKVHSTRKAFHDARRQCQTEGATLFYPEDTAEAEVAMALWNRSEPYGWIYLGITDLLVKGHWETVDGRPLLDLYVNWGAGQPDDTGRNEDCVLWRRDKTFNDYTCHEEYPFICKKSLEELESYTPCDKQITTVQPKPAPPSFREDYTLIEETKSFYKVHTTRKAFHDARRQCQTEGATLFYPEDKAEAEVAMALWNRSEPYGWIYLGITDLLVKGHWETVDGRPLLDVYVNWGAGQPDDTGRNEDCVLWRRDKTFNDYTCHEEYPFICKKSLQELESYTPCDKQITNVQPKPTFREDYTFIEETKAFYKVHTTRIAKAFHDARRQCQTEGATLFYPEDKAEAEVAMALWNRSEPYGWIYLGITDLLVKGYWETVDGRPLLDVYVNWGAGQPDDTGRNEDCVLWRRDKTFNDYTCHEEYPFICKKSLQELHSKKPCDTQIANVQPLQPKPTSFREDYTLIEETKAFYKVHTTRKAFHDARRQCQTEGATLFYPEDKAEAEVAMALWNRSEPYGWIYLGITDLLVKGYWETVDGRSLLDVYVNWGAGQPDDTGRNEDCVLWRRDKTFNDYTCHEEYPFICKKSLQELHSKKPCDTQIANVQPLQPKPTSFREDYTLIEETKAFYKVHTTRKAFHDARRQCQTEGATLFYPEDKAEAEVAMALWNRSEPYGWIYLGITDLLVKGHWETVDGRPLLDVYYNWGAYQPDDTGGNEDCVLWRRDKTLNDYTCHEEYPFICKKSQLLLGHIPDPVVTEKPKSKFYRKDYTFIEESQAFYKIHTIHRSWHDARMRCQREGATLFHPENEVEAEAVMGFWNKTQPFKWMYLGVSDLLKKRVWETVDGRLLEDVYNNWGPEQPDNIDGIEDCVIWRRDKTLNDYSCHDKYPYICKKSLRSLDWNTLCDMPDKSYHFNKDLGKCYKFHLAPKNWTDAHAICSSEQSYLAIINSQSEADYLVKVTEEAPKNRIRGNFLSGAVYLGFHNRNENGWETIKGTTLEESGYTGWGNQQPDGGDRETCGSMFYNGRLNDLGCSQRCFFICEHDIGALGSAIDERFGQ